MKYYSTNGRAPVVGFREAVLQGIAPDGGLYFPENIPVVSPEAIARFREMDRAAIATELLASYVGSDLREQQLNEVCTRTLDFSLPLIALDDNRFILELFHGPTLAFKDVGARFLSNCLRHFIGSSQQKRLVVVATSGDTGGAVANSFIGVPGIDVAILFPKGKVSEIQRLQLTTGGSSIHAIEVEGDFDTCQQLTKAAFHDPNFSGRLLSANSINIARWLPQQLYYWFAFLQWKASVPPMFVVPSGNLGNLCSGLLAHLSGMPASGFVAACNNNATIPDFLSDGVYKARPSRHTLSNAMDVGDPNNFQRLVHLLKASGKEPSELLSGYSISDAQTLTTIRSVWEQHHYVLDPHTAVGLAAFEKHREAHQRAKGILLSTAHPVKFRESVELVTETRLELPAVINNLLMKPAVVQTIGPTYGELQEVIRSIL